jgi:DNA-binding HxlR family transcriptional regulator
MPKILNYDVFRRSCPSQTVLDVLANKWVYLVICALGSNAVRFGDLKRRIEGVTPKMLTQTLRVLERDGLVEREIYPVIPPRVEYRLTKLGQELIGLLDAILRWSEVHAPEILKARARAQQYGSAPIDRTFAPSRRRRSPEAPARRVRKRR